MLSSSRIKIYIMRHWLGSRILKIKLLLTLFFVTCFLQGLHAEQSLRNKIGEMLIIGFHEDDFCEHCSIANNIKNNHVGGVILFAGPGLGVEQGSLRNVKNPAQLKTLLTAIHDHAKKYRLKNEGPFFVAIDQEGGFVTRLPNDRGFGHENISAKNLGVINNPNRTYLYAKSLGEYLKELGINLNFAPVVDLAVDQNNFIYKRERCFSDDPQLVYTLSQAFINGMHESGIITTLKHFPGHGSSLADSHKGVADVSNTWTCKELQPYQKFISDGYRDMIMASHVINRQLDNGCNIKNKLGEDAPIPTTFSKKMLTDLLRNRLGFQGVIVTDDMTMGAIADQYAFEDSLKHAIQAGVDMIILANHQEDQTTRAIDIIEHLVLSGQINPQRIDDSYNRILRLKRTY